MRHLDKGLLYLSLHNLLLKKVGSFRRITTRDFFCILGKHYLVPKSMRPLIIKEMIKRDLIIKVDKYTLEVLPCDINLEKDINKLYEEAGLY